MAIILDIWSISSFKLPIYFTMDIVLYINTFFLAKREEVVNKISQFHLIL